MEQYISRSQAARAATRKGLPAFECKRPNQYINRWIIEERNDGPGIQYAKLFADGKDWIHHCEITDKLIPILVVSCLREEIIEKIPELFRIEPLTPELWANARKQYPNPEP